MKIEIFVHEFVKIEIFLMNSWIWKYLFMNSWKLKYLLMNSWIPIHLWFLVRKLAKPFLMKLWNLSFANSWKSENPESNHLRVCTQTVEPWTFGMHIIFDENIWIPVMQCPMVESSFDLLDKCSRESLLNFSPMQQNMVKEKSLLLQILLPSIMQIPCGSSVEVVVTSQSFCHFILTF